MPPSLPPLPTPLQTTLRSVRPLVHATTWLVFLCLLIGLLTGHTTRACVRASLLCARVSWQQCCDFFRRARWSRSAFLAATTAVVRRARSPDGLPARRWWVVDPTTSDQPSARTVVGSRTCWRGCRRPGQTRTHQGHGWRLLAQLHQRADGSWQALLIGALRWRQVRCAPPARWARVLVAQGPAPAPVRQVVVSDRGLNRRQGVHWLRAQDGHRVTRLKRNTVVDTPAEAPAVRGRGRPRTYGTKDRVDALDRRLLLQQAVSVWVDGRWQPATTWRGTFWRRGLPELVTLVIVETAGRAPWRFHATDATLTTEAIVAGDHGRHAIEPAVQDANALGLDRYHGRTARGARRWPLLIGLAHSLLAVLALGALAVPLPTLGWPWYQRENTVGQLRRRLLAALAQAGMFVPEGGLGHPMPKSMPARPPGERVA